jgi:hypothetical protein
MFTVSEVPVKANSLALGFIVCPLLAAAQEPGYFHIETPPPPAVTPAPAAPPAPPSRPAPSPSTPLLSSRFSQARGLKDYEVQTLHYQRVSCDRRIFTASGQSIEGDGDLKATKVDPDFLEIEFPAHVSFESYGARNPYQNGVADMDTVTGRQLISVRGWIDGQTLKLRKYVTVSFVQEGTAPKTVRAEDEFRVMDGTYPSTYLVRETVFLDSGFVLYYMCQ